MKRRALAIFSIAVFSLVLFGGTAVCQEQQGIDPLRNIIGGQTGTQQKSPGTMQEGAAKAGKSGEVAEEDIGVEEKVELKEKEEIKETVPEPYTRSVGMPKIEAGKEFSRLELLYLGRISEEKQILEQFGYEIFAPPEKEQKDISRGDLEIDLKKEDLTEGDVEKLLEAKRLQDMLPQMPPAGFDKSYVLGPGDEIQIFLSGEGVNIYLSKSIKEGGSAFLPLYVLPIDNEGKVYYPPVGTVYLWGKTIMEAEDYLKAEMVKYIKDVEVSLSLRRVRRFPIFVVGEVKKPGTVMVNGFSTVMDALFLAEGVKKTGSLRTIFVKRNNEKIADLDIYDLLLKGERGGDILLKDRDVVVVPSIGDTAAAWGMVKRPGIFEFREGETIEDLFSFAGGVLPGANVFSMTLTTNLSEGKKVIREVKQDLSGFVMQNGDVLTVSPLADELREFVELKGHLKNPGLYQWREGMRVKEVLGSEDNFLPEGLFEYGEIIRRLPPDYLPESISFNPREALKENPEHDRALMRGDIITLFSVWDLKKKPFVRVEGEVENPGRYRWVRGMTIRDIIRISGGLSRAARLDEAELWRYELKEGKYTIKFNRKVDLSKTLQGDSRENSELQPFDQIVVKSIGSFEQLIWKANIKGEVGSPGSYPIKRGERLSDLIQRASGMTEFAYPRGVVLLRKSVEDLQRKRLKVLISELESSLLKEEAASVAVAEASEAAIRRQVLESRRSLLSVMKEKMELVVGRVVVKIDRDSDRYRGTDRDIVLEDGDELFIPPVPSYVLMMGDVFNQVGLTYNTENRLGDYLNEVGGITRNADRKGMYIIRADGTVVSNESNEFIDMIHWDSDRNRFAAGGLYLENIYPGDTVIVPTETKFPIPWRPLIKDITQIIFQTLATVAIIDNLGD